MTGAAKLQKKTIDKGKLKKSIKNILCRPDPIFWPAVSAEDSSKLEIILNKYKIDIPEYKRPHWNEIKAIPKENRPKPPNIPKVEGLLFGISECLNAVQKLQCSAFIIEATVNPHTIVHPLLEKCYSTKIPVLCMYNLKKTCANNFGIPTSCLGIRNNSLHGLHTGIVNISKGLKYPEVLNNEMGTTEMNITTEMNMNNREIKMDTDTQQNRTVEKTLIQYKISDLPYLYRTNKKARVFIPSLGTIAKTTREFAGDDFIELPHKDDHKPNSNKKHMKMLIKKILLNNPNREKRKEIKNKE